MPELTTLATVTKELETFGHFTRNGEYTLCGEKIEILVDIESNYRPKSHKGVWFKYVWRHFYGPRCRQCVRSSSS